ncbi:MAG: coproporphyrinogen dehydrogenase HemZ [Ruminococcaceae bacterium]|nr:coproporphyrinogen dehydrogenase HemZ [Oscillospiraceae bacterium]
MKLELTGSESRYALEQLAITLFPGESHSWVEGEENGTLHITVRRTDARISAVAQLSRAQGSARGTAFCNCSRDVAPERYGALEKQTLRRAFYRAAVQLLPAAPVWGALSGVRPAKLGRLLIAETGSPARAVKKLMESDFVRRDKALLAVSCAEEALSVMDGRDECDVDVYIGVPFCPTRCSYCSFVSAAVGKQKKLIAPYAEALVKEIRHGAALLRECGLRVRTLYMGGGTPTTLEAPQLDAVLTAAWELPIVEGAEITVEAGRPDTITSEKLAVLRKHKVRRISINPQTMDDRVLEVIGRRHTAQDIADAMALARKLGFEEINMDLIAGLPTDTAAGFAQTLDKVIALGPENITVHTLARKRGADLGQSSESVLPTEVLEEMLAHAETVLTGAGYAPYYLYRQKYIGGSFENIGWTKPGKRCDYNIAMMEEIGTVVAFGAGSVTKLVRGGEIRRIQNPKYAQEYLSNLEQLLEKKAEVVAFYGLRGKDTQNGETFSQHQNLP